MLINCAHIICYSKITLEQRNEDYLCSLIGICFFWKTLKRKKSGGKIKNQGRNGRWRRLIKSWSEYSRIISIHSKADYDQQLLDATTVIQCTFTYSVIINHSFYILVINLIRRLFRNRNELSQVIKMFLINYRA